MHVVEELSSAVFFSSILPLVEEWVIHLVVGIELIQCKILAEIGYFLVLILEPLLVVGVIQLDQIVFLPHLGFVGFLDDFAVDEQVR